MAKKNDVEFAWADEEYLSQWVGDLLEDAAIKDDETKDAIWTKAEAEMYRLMREHYPNATLDILHKSELSQALHNRFAPAPRGIVREVGDGFFETTMAYVRNEFAHLLQL